MAPDLLSTIRREIDERLNELRPLLLEHEQLLVAAHALETTDQEGGMDTPLDTASPATRTRRTAARTTRRGSAAGAIRRAASSTSDVTTEENIDEPHAAPLKAAAVQPSTQPTAEKHKSSRAARGAAREAILAALDHGSHTIGELVIVTAMSAPNINGNLRRLLSERAVAKTEREGKAAWALAEATV